ncbi:hypothetical protein, partial [Clostridium perfringens]|uniref:hypothetical protein n=1 Tax=Clostridium perfringens TaxID=1502 RepID=UPI002468E8BD
EIFPNMHFNELNPDILPYYGAFEVPTSVQEWPALKPGQVRRASVNSFGKELASLLETAGMNRGRYLSD